MGIRKNSVAFGLHLKRAQPRSNLCVVIRLIRSLAVWSKDRKNPALSKPKPGWAVVACSCLFSPAHFLHVGRCGHPHEHQRPQANQNRLVNISHGRKLPTKQLIQVGHEASPVTDPEINVVSAVPPRPKASASRHGAARWPPMPTRASMALTF